MEPIYQALLLGNKTQISDEQWQLLRQTGTTHLMAISGLHMGIMAMLGYLLFRGLWWLCFYRFTLLNRPFLGAFGAFLFASFYLLISGASVPTQRAWLMVLAVLLFVVLRRHFHPWRALALAAFLVVCWHAFSLLSIGFWLSFVAVAIIFLTIQLTQRSGWLKKLIVVQWFLTWGLAPLVVFYFAQLPLLSWLANVVAVPLVSLFALPLLLGALLLSFINDFSAYYSWQLVDFVWQAIWQYLQQLQQWSLMHDLLVEYPPVSFGWLLTAMTVFFGLLLIRSRAKTDKIELECMDSAVAIKQKNEQKTVPSTDNEKPVLSGDGVFRWLTNHSLLILPVAMLLMLVWPIVIQSFGLTQRNPEKPIPVALFSDQTEPAEFTVTVLDVSQGLSVVIETANHVLVYDSGAQWGKTDAAKIAVLPYLKFQRWSKLDQLIISHSDNDHAGGAASIMQSLPVKRLSSGQVDKMPSNKTGLSNWQFCTAGQTRVMDGVRFEFFSPSETMLKQGVSDNDSSCVLKVSNEAQTALLMGDASSEVERQLMNQFADSSESLQAGLLIAGHHGSKYSTSSAWLNKVKPQHIVFSSGYKNRYRFPAKETLQCIESYMDKRRLQLLNQQGLESSTRMNASAKTAKNAVQWWNTACSGALAFAFGKQIKLRYQARNKLMKWYHHRCNAAEQGIFYQ